jgi:hypothetical protein
LHGPEVTEARSHRSRWRVTGAVSSCACPRKAEGSYEAGFVEEPLIFLVLFKGTLSL